MKGNNARVWKGLEGAERDWKGLEGSGRGWKVLEGRKRTAWPGDRVRIEVNGEGSNP